MDNQQQWREIYVLLVKCTGSADISNTHNVSVVEDHEPCWCESGKQFGECHRMNAM